MKYFFFILVFAMTGCSEQPANVQQTNIDSLPPPEPLAVQYPVSESRRVEYDSTWLIIKISNSRIRASLLNQQVNMKTLKELDKFISIHKNEVDSGKIFIQMSPGLSKDRFKSALTVLKKHHYYKFGMATL